MFFWKLPRQRINDNRNSITSSAKPIRRSSTSQNWETRRCPMTVLLPKRFFRWGWVKSNSPTLWECGKTICLWRGCLLACRDQVRRTTSLLSNSFWRFCGSLPKVSPVRSTNSHNHNNSRKSKGETRIGFQHVRQEPRQESPASRILWVREVPQHFGRR